MRVGARGCNSALLGADGRVGGARRSHRSPRSTTRRPAERASGAPGRPRDDRRRRSSRSRRCATWLSTAAGRAAIPLAIVTAFALLAEATIAVAWARSWHASWWEWHLLMLVAFGAIAWAAHREDEGERFSDLYLDETAAGKREVSVVFADLEGYTSFSEAPRPARGLRDAERLLRGRDPGDRPRARRGDRPPDRRRDHGDVQHARRPARPRASARRARRSRSSARQRSWPSATPTGRVSESASTAARRWSASSARLAGAATRSSATPSTWPRGSRARRPVGGVAVGVGDAERAARGASPPARQHQGQGQVAPRRRVRARRNRRPVALVESIGAPPR